MTQNISIFDQEIQLLENRLNKQHYFSIRGLPSSLDAKIFLILKQLQSNCLFCPNRQTAPKLYHWFVMLSQFSPTLLANWIATSQEDYEDDICLKKLRAITQKLNPSEKTADTSSQGQNKKIGQIIEESSLQGHLVKFIMIVIIKKSSQIPIQKHIHKFLTEKDVTITKFQPRVLNQSQEIYIEFDSTPQQCSNLNNQISKWSQVQLIQIKQGKKVTIRYHTL